MMQRRILSRLAIFTALLLSITQVVLHAKKIGSDSAVSIEPHYTFLASSTVDHSVKSFAWMKHGFTLEDATTSCTFEPIFSVGETADFRGGTLYLNTDLCFNEMSTLKNTGNIVSAQSQTVDLAPTMTYFANTSYTTILDDISLNMHYDLTLEGTVIIQNDVAIHGNNHVLDLGSGAIFVKKDSKITLHNVSLVGIAQSNISCEAATSQIILKDSSWYQDDNTFTFTQGSIVFKNAVSLVGSAIFNYASSMTSTVSKNSVLRLSDGMHFQIGRASSGGSEPIYFEDPNSSLLFDNGSLHISEHGARLTRGSFLITGELEIDIAGTTSTNGLMLGDTTEDDDLRIELLPGAHAKFLNGYVGIHFVNQLNFRAQASATQITRKSDNIFSLFSDFTLKNLTIEAEAGSTLLFAEGTNLYYDNVTILLNKASFDVTGHRYNAFTTVLDGNNELFLSKGTLPAYTRVEGDNNYLRGLGTISGLVYLTGTDAKLYFDFDGNINQSIQLNGGSIELERNLNCAYDAVIVGAGTIYLNNNTWYLGTSPTTWEQILTISSSSGVIQCNANLTINSSIAFSGDTVIEGRYHQLILGTEGELVIQPGSTLTLKNFNIEGLKGNKIRCIDETSTIAYENTRCILDTTYSVTVGAVQIKEKVEFTGTGTFLYQSPTSLCINNESELLIKSIGFDVRKTGSASSEPLKFENKTGTLHLKNASFASGQYGMNFFKGKLLLENDVTFYLNSTSVDDAFVLGDLTEENDPKWIFVPGAVVTYNPGSYLINLYDKNNLISRSNITHILRKTGSNFYFNSDITLLNLTITSEFRASNFVAAGYFLDFHNCILLGSGYSFDITGRRYNQYTNTLNGNDEISLTKGTLPAFTRVKDKSNIIHGTGDISGKITLVDQNATLTLALNGSVYKKIAMNNGTLAITRDLNMAYNSVFTGSGTLELEKSTVTFGLQESELTGTLLMKSSESSLRLRNKMILSGELILDGDITIDGDSNILEFSSTGSFIIKPNTTVRFKNIVHKNIAGLNLYATDTTSLIVFENSASVLSNDYSYT
ncbi:hypothetical protein JKY79_02095, partial [Candidatus Babeliales bacterium]|nr:hypothetical protein [Candidatus Babeliales bacterium]